MSCSIPRFPETLHTYSQRRPLLQLKQWVTDSGGGEKWITKASRARHAGIRDALSAVPHLILPMR